MTKSWALTLGTGEAVEVTLEVERGLILKVEGKETAREIGWLHVDSLRHVAAKLFVRIVANSSKWWEYEDVTLCCASDDEARALKIEMGNVRGSCELVFDFQKESKSMFGHQYFACEVTIKAGTGVRVTYPGHAKEVEFYKWENVVELTSTRGVSFTGDSIKNDNMVCVVVLQDGARKDKIYKCKDEVQAQEFVTALSKMRAGFTR